MWIDRRWLVPCIAASVLLNVFLIGIVAGHIYADWGLRAARVALIPDSHVQGLPSDERSKFLAVMSARRPAIVAARKVHLVARHALEAAITAPAFDRDHVAAAFADLRRAGLTLQEQTQGALTEALATLTPASRAAIVAHAPGGEELR